MSDTKTAEPATSGLRNSDATPSPRYSPKAARTTRLVVTSGLILVAALFIFLVTRAPVEDARPTSLGFSLNSFFRWLGNLNPLAQIPLVILVFGIVVAVILVLIEFAPRAGRGYFWLRLAA